MNTRETVGFGLEQRLRNKISGAEHALVLPVGGGNDDVSSLILQEQLKRDFGFKPQSVSIMGVLPDCLDYHNTEPTSHSLIQRITPSTQRSVQGRMMTQFSERVLAQYQNEFGIDAVLGVSMRKGSRGVTDALNHICQENHYDLVLACDVGGDFLAIPENHSVLSPMMDGYMLSALRELQKSNTIPMVYGVFGLGTDGETPPPMLIAALKRLSEVHEGEFTPSQIEPIARFHRNYVEPIRYSRTADFTLKEISKEGHPNPAEYRARFHTKPSKESGTKVYYGPFMHDFDPRFFGKYYLFDDVQGVDNPYAIDCGNGLEWFLRVSDIQLRINHELNGQAFGSVGHVLSHIGAAKQTSIFFGTPSHKFDSESIEKIAADVLNSVRNGVYNHALIFGADTQHQNVAGLSIEPVTNDIVIVSQHFSDVAKGICAMGKS